MFSKTKNITDSRLVFDYLKGLIISAIISMGLVVLFAFCMKWFMLDELWIMPTTMVIKGLSTVIGSILAVSGEEKGLVKGAGFGMCYTFFAFLIFSLLSGSFNLDLSLLLDAVSMTIIGGIVGIIKVNKK